MDIFEEFEKILAFWGEDKDVVDEGSEASVLLVGSGREYLVWNSLDDGIFSSSSNDWSVALEI